MSDKNKTKKLASYLDHLLLFVVLAIVLYVRMRLLAVPLERDEGEYGYMAQLLIKGIPPYLNAYTMKLPGASFMYALIMLVFGQSPSGIHSGLILVNGICIYFVYLLSRKLLGSNAACAAGATYAILSLSYSVLGVFAHATHFVVMFSLAGFLLLLSYLDTRRSYVIMFAGLCFGLSIIMKQHAVIITLFAFIYLAWRLFKSPQHNARQNISAVSLFVLGVTIPYLLLLCYALKTGAFEKFWFWTVLYSSKYASANSLNIGLNIFISHFEKIYSPQLPLWLIAFAGVLALMTRTAQGIDRLFISGFTLFSFIAICPGFYFREHYFVLILPAAAILVGAAYSLAIKALSSFKTAGVVASIPILLLSASLGYGFFKESFYIFNANPSQVSRISYGSNPFPEALEIARYIKERTSSSDRIAIFGSEPEILVYADRLSATGYIYMYGLMDSNPFAEKMQMEMIKEIEESRPSYVVLVKVATSWLVGPDSAMNIFKWGKVYSQREYDVVGVIDILDSYTTTYVWGSEAAMYSPKSEDYVIVYKRRFPVRKAVD